VPLAVHYSHISALALKLMTLYAVIYMHSKDDSSQLRLTYDTKIKKNKSDTNHNTEKTSTIIP